MKQRLSSAPFRCLILGMACTAVSVSVRASNADTMHDISSEFAWECKIVCVKRNCTNLLYAPYWGNQS